MNRNLALARSFFEIVINKNAALAHSFFLFPQLMMNGFETIDRISCTNRCKFAAL
jgi:hypothetical protein